MNSFTVVTTMKCFHLHSRFIPFLSQLKHKHQLNTGKLVWLTSNEAAARISFFNRDWVRPLHNQSIPSKVPPRTKALTTSLVLGVTSPAKSPDFSVLLLTSAGFLFMYWIANFVVPEIVLKDLQLEDSKKDQKSNSGNPLGDKKQSTPTSNTSSQTEKQGSNSTK